MPAESIAQRRLMAACEHAAEYPSCKKMRKSMTTSQMHDFAATKEKGLPKRKPKGFHVLIAIGRPKK